MVVFWKFFENSKGEIDPKTGKPKQIPMLRHYTVFNVEQCDGLPPLPSVQPERSWNPIDEAKRIVDQMPQRPPITEDGKGRAYYAPATDSVHMPKRGTFHTDSDWYATLFHELSHSAGHESRLGRDLSGKLDSSPVLACLGRPFARFACAQHPQRRTASVLIRFHTGLDLQHRITHRGQAVTAVGRREELRLHQAGPIGQGEKFHRLAGDLVVGALLDDQAARHHAPPDVAAKA